MSLLLAATENAFSKDLQKAFDEVVLFNQSERTDNIANVVPGDYDGDTQMDILVAWQQASGYIMEVYWGAQKNEIGMYSCTVFETCNFLSDCVDNILSKMLFFFKNI